MTQMTECIIDSIRVSLTNQDRIVVLKDKDSERYLPIWIGLFESESITIALQGVQTARPLTHDLFLDTLEALNAQLLQVEITSIESDVYYAHLVLIMDGKQINVDCRPSDALALLVRAHVPIMVAEEIMSKFAIQPEDQQAYDLSAIGPEEEDPIDLSVFSDFLNTLETPSTEEDQDDDSENKTDKDAPEQLDSGPQLES